MVWQSKAESKDKRAAERVSVVMRGTNRCLRIIAASYDDLIQTHASHSDEGMDLIAGAVEFRAAADGWTSVSVGARFCLNSDDDDVAGMLERGLELEERGARRAEGRRSSKLEQNDGLRVLESEKGENSGFE